MCEIYVKHSEYDYLKIIFSAQFSEVYLITINKQKNILNFYSIVLKSIKTT